MKSFLIYALAPLIFSGLLEKNENSISRKNKNKKKCKICEKEFFSEEFTGSSYCSKECFKKSYK